VPKQTPESTGPCPHAFARRASAELFSTYNVDPLSLGQRFTGVLLALVQAPSALVAAVEALQQLFLLRVRERSKGSRWRRSDGGLTRTLATRLHAKRVWPRESRPIRVVSSFVCRLRSNRRLQASSNLNSAIHIRRQYCGGT
jgi:hypothetical protein